MMAKVWYKYGYFWRRGDGDDDQSPLDRGDGTGDLIFNTLSKIVEDEDTSKWAFYSWLSCAGLLMDRKRWPNEFNAGTEAWNRWVWYPYIWITKRNKRKWTRPQSDMTRDPYHTFGDCYAHLYGTQEEFFNPWMKNVFKMVKIPWYVFRLDTWIWRRRLIKDNSPHYVKRLRMIKSRAKYNWFKKNYEDDFYEDTT